MNKRDGPQPKSSKTGFAVPPDWEIRKGVLDGRRGIWVKPSPRAAPASHMNWAQLLHPDTWQAKDYRRSPKFKEDMKAGLFPHEVDDPEELGSLVAVSSSDGWEDFSDLPVGQQGVGMQKNGAMIDALRGAMPPREMKFTALDPEVMKSGATDAWTLETRQLHALGPSDEPETGVTYDVDFQDDEDDPATAKGMFFEFKGPVEWVSEVLYMLVRRVASSTKRGGAVDCGGPIWSVDSGLRRVSRRRRSGVLWTVVLQLGPVDCGVAITAQ